MPRVKFVLPLRIHNYVDLFKIEFHCALSGRHDSRIDIYQKLGNYIPTENLLCSLFTCYEEQVLSPKSCVPEYAKNILNFLMSSLLEDIRLIIHYMRK